MKLSTFAVVGASVLSVHAAAEKRDPKNVAALDELLQAYENDHHNEKRKNVASLEDLQQAYDEDHQNEKRKNVAGLDDLRQAYAEDHPIEKRKNVAALEELLQAYKEDHKKQKRKNVAALEELFAAYKEDHPNEKRKNTFNVAHLEELLQKHKNEKRKNTFNLAHLEHLLQEAQESAENGRRDARRVVNPKLFFELKHHEKRSQNVITFLGPLVENVLTQVRDVSVIAGYLRDLESLLDQLHKAPFAVIIAPTDHALANKLNGHKPWEFPRDPENEEDAEKNISDFVKAHLVKFEGDFEEIDSEVSLHSLSGQKVVIRHDAATDAFSVKLGEKWVDVLAVYHADDGAVLVIDDVFVKP